ncbi:DUF1737 domain-containing protein [Stappia indica]|uniref:DUF1737 domain-containing protein n=1 Tax=Stappia indica TaxID=538381 RepID=A0A285SWF6_9HYPH|nr:DUF1737 domain-containing protein [Stappia indica]SOC12982.1 hypothetical protein SAMN05421512_10764 [Stappia indica]
MMVYRVLTGVNDAAFCHRVTEALSLGWSLHGAPSLAYDSTRRAVICGQAIVKQVEGGRYDPALDLSRQ